MTEKNTPSQHLNVLCLTPDKKVFQGEASMVTIPGEEGEFGVLPRHMPFVSLLREGFVKVYQNNTIVETIAITGGVAEIYDDFCRILADGILSTE